MTSKVYILLMISFFVCLMAPKNGYACGTNSKKTDKSCCIQDKSNNSKKNNCCESHKMTRESKDKSCGGNCNNPKCTCPTSFALFALQDRAELIREIRFSEINRLKSYYNETYSSSGFGYIWIPPNIA
jgi:hypothetical protein